MSEKSHVGCLLGTAVGDALGLPYEGLSTRRAARLFPDRRRHHLLLNRGMVSDDTEHACFTAQALMRARGNADLFRKRLARSLRWWLLALPAGVGSATARSIVKLWLGWPSDRSGIYSAGNGPAMRSAIIGVVHRDDLGALRRFVEASTRVTHTDPKAYFAALAVALAAAYSSRHTSPSAADFCAELQSLLDDEGAAEFLELVRQQAEGDVQGLKRLCEAEARARS